MYNEIVTRLAVSGSILILMYSIESAMHAPSWFCIATATYLSGLVFWISGD